MTSCLLAALLAAPLLTAQEPPEGEAQAPKIFHSLPDDVQPFWQIYWPAKQGDDEDNMDQAVRMNADLADRTLNILLDEYCTTNNDEMPDELRSLAWTMDRVRHGTRYIERVRFVIGLDPGQRRRRYTLMMATYDADKAYEAAIATSSDTEWARVAESFDRLSAGFEELGEIEYALRSLKQVADIELRRNRMWERGQIYKRIAALAPKMPYKDPLADEAVQELKLLYNSGIDPDKPKPEAGAGTAPGAAGGAGGASGGGGAAGAGETKESAAAGRTLESYATGSADLKVPLVLDSPKKGLAPVVLPSFAPLEDEYLWNWSWIDKEQNPALFDTQRSVWLGPLGKQWKLMREGQEFGIDADGDGTADVNFTASSNPQRIEVPLTDGRKWPLMVSVPGDREAMFGVELNYSPTMENARLRFQLAGAQKGEVQGEPWLVYDNNITGVFGDIVDEMGDGWTPSTPGEETVYRSVDAVLVGKARVAQPWSSVMPLADGFYRASITPEGTELTLRKLNLQTGQVKLDCATKIAPTHILIEETSGDLPGAVLNVVPAKRGASVTVPVGKWRFAFGRLESGSKTGMKQVRLYRGKCQPFDVKEGETVTLAFGAPYALRLQPSADQIKSAEGETQVRFDSLRVFGRGGEEYALLHDEPLQPEVEIFGPDGKKLVKATKTLRPDIALWQALGEHSMYVPAPLVLPELKGGPFTFRLSQKSHALLGGPLLPEEEAKPVQAAGKP